MAGTASGPSRRPTNLSSARGRCGDSAEFSRRRAAGRAPTARVGPRSRASPRRRWSGCRPQNYRNCSPCPRSRRERLPGRRSAPLLARQRGAVAAACPGHRRFVAWADKLFLNFVRKMFCTLHLCLILERK